MPPRKRKQTNPVLKAAEPKNKETFDELKMWRTRAAHARRVRKDWETKFNVERLEKYFLGDQDKVGGLNSNEIVLNQFLATIKTMRPGLLFSMPKYFVRPKPGQKAPAMELKAAIGEGILEAIGNQDQNLKKSAKLAILQAFFRTGNVKTIYDPKMVPNPRAGEPMVVTDDQGVPVKDENGETEQRKNPLTGEVIVEPDRVLTDEVYRYCWVDARNMLYPDEGPDMARWTWMGEEITVALDEAKEDTRFPKGLRDQFTSNAKNKSAELRSRSKITPGKEEELFSYVEAYDLKKQRMLVWADGQPFDEFLIHEPVPDGVEDHPYGILVMGEPVLGPDAMPWPMPLTRDWVDPQNMINVSARMTNEGARRSARKGVYFEGSFDDADEAEKLLQNPDDMTFSKCTDPRLVPIMLDAPNLNPAIMQTLSIAINSWNTQTGQSSRRLLRGQDQETATGELLEDRAANVRDADLQDVVQDWLSILGQKMLQRVQATMTFGMWVKMRGFSDSEFLQYAERYLGMPQERMMVLLQMVPQIKDVLRERFSQERMVQVSREELTFQADVSVVPGSTRPRNLQEERRSMMQFLQVIGQFPQLALSRSLLQMLARTFEFIDDRMIDELVALAQKMVQINANQAGRTQGGESGGQSSTAGNPDVGALVQGMMAARGG